MGIKIRVLQKGDTSVLMNVAPQVFDNTPVRTWTDEFLADPRHHIAVAIDNGTVVAFASGVHYIHPDKPPELWINEVSVSPAYRKRRLGQAVLKALLEAARAYDCRIAWVLTYRTNIAAMALYRSLGGTEGADRSGPPDALTGFSFPLK